MAKRKKSKENEFHEYEVAFDQKTGKIVKVARISMETLTEIQVDLNEMYAIVKSCAEWEHSRTLDKRIQKFLDRVLARKDAS